MEKNFKFPPARDYTKCHKQIESLCSGETDQIANMANAAALLKENFDFFWVGFYIVKPGTKPGSKELVLGPFQGPLACTRIAYGRGVCGSAWQQGKTLVVADVDEFPGHIACSNLSRSEIVVPLFHSVTKEVIGVLDIDHTIKNAFCTSDASALESICKTLCQN